MKLPSALKDFFEFFMEHRELRLRIVLLLSVVVLFFVLTIKITKHVVFDPSPQRGSLVAVKCFKCGFAEDRLLIDVRTAKCAKCGGKVGLHLKCLSCDYEYAFLRPDMSYRVFAGKSKDDRLLLYQDQQICPICESNQVITLCFTKK